MGTPQAAVPSLLRCISDGHEVAAVYTQPDRPSGRGQKISQSAVKIAALQHAIPVLQPTKLRITESIEEFRGHAADVAVVVAYGRILPSDYLDAFRFGAVNVHFSLLPKYRGAAPVNWAIARGEKTTGVTTMKMDEGLDTGDILLQSETEIWAKENAVELITRLSESGAELLSDTLEKLDTIEPRVQDHSAATMAPVMSKEDGRIDWSLSAHEIERRIRGFQPFPGSFTYLGDSRLTIWGGRVMTDEHLSGSDGEVTAIHKTEIVINCGGSTALGLTELQPEGKRRMAIRDFLNGSRLQEGMKLGSNG